MKLYFPQDAPSARERSLTGDEVWTPTLVQSEVFVSNLGRLFSSDREIWELTYSTQGYAHVHLPAYGKAYAHWLVLASFEGIQPRRRVVRANGDKTDNRLCNLGWSPTAGTLSAEEKELVLERLRNGVRQCEIAREFGLTSSHIAYYKRKLQE